MSQKKLRLEFKLNNFAAEQEEGRFTAYGNVFDVIDSHRDVTLKGAFRKSIQMHKSAGTSPRMLWNHNPDEVIGKWGSFSEDERGLKMEGVFALATQRGRETYELIKMGAIDSLSIGYVVTKEKFDGIKKVNYLEEVDLYEVSIVTFPANKESVVTDIKSDQEEEPENTEQLNTDVKEETTVEPESTPETQPVEQEESQPEEHQKSDAELFEEAKRNALISVLLKSFIRQ
ncbi:HK97 family phage prohead protease [Aeromonas salmonicida]|uniref:HK97 family phage prohead protease n=1 Tax=Aeromonas salmonicida TaxID=645 RepID=UPI003D3115AD